MTLEVKDPEEIISLAFDFTAEMGAEAITPASAVISIAVVKGVDANVAAMISGQPVISGLLVYQNIANGVDGADYKLRCRIDTDAGRRLVLSTQLPVRTR